MSDRPARRVRQDPLDSGWIAESLGAPAIAYGDTVAEALDALDVVLDDYADMERERR